MDLSVAKKVHDELITPLSRRQCIDLYDDAKKEDITVSQLLEKRDPSPDKSEIDAFQRQFMVANLQTSGLRAATVGQLFSSTLSHLAPEFVRRAIIKGMGMLRSADTSSLVAFETRVIGNNVQPMFLDQKTTKGGSLKKVTRGAKLATIEILYRDKSIDVKPYGKVLNVDYDVVKNKSLVEFQQILWIIGKNLILDEITDIETVLRAGDGTVGAATYVTSATETAELMVYGDFVDAIIGFDILYKPNTFFMTDVQAKAFLKMSEIKDPLAFTTFTETGMFMTPFGALVVRNPSGDNQYTTMFDRQHAVARGVETPLTLEADKIISRRIDEVLIYEAICYWIAVDGARGGIDFTS